MFDKVNKKSFCTTATSLYYCMYDKSDNNPKKRYFLLNQTPIQRKDIFQSILTVPCVILWLPSREKQNQVFWNLSRANFKLSTIGNVLYWQRMLVFWQISGSCALKKKISLRIYLFLLTVQIDIWLFSVVFWGVNLGPNTGPIPLRNFVIFSQFHVHIFPIRKYKQICPCSIWRNDYWKKKEKWPYKHLIPLNLNK